MTDRFRIGATLCLGAFAAAVYAATALRFSTEINVSNTPTPTEKAKVVRLAYVHGGAFRKVWLFTYGDGPANQQNVYARYSFDEAVTWSAPILLSRDASDAPTGGQTITTKGSLSFVVDNEKPTIFAPPVTSGPLVMITWNSAYCPQNPAASNNAGSYVNPDQGAGDFDEDGTLDRPFHCVWVATTTDPALVAWDVHQLTNGERDAINEVISGSSTGTSFAMAWQEDPAGLQPGEGEGRGDGGMGSHVSGGTNIWYTHAPNPNGVTLRANIAQLSDNNVPGTGNPGASRPNLQLSGSTAVVAYEETSCPGGASGKCIVYHAFPYTAHDANAAGTIISDVTQNARRVRFFLQGATTAGTSGLRTVVLWRETPFVTPAAPSDIIVRRGLVDTAARPGSTGFLASDILADPPQNMTNIARSGGNANAHRAVVRGSLVALAYDLTPNMDAANPEKTPVPTANYNLFVTRSVQDGTPGSWSAPVNLSRIDSPALTVVEPRMVPTPGTMVNPLTGTPDAGDTQNPNAIFIAYATETNTPIGMSGRVLVSRSMDQGATFEPFMPVSSAAAGQSESQLRPTPDGSSTMVLWMGEQVAGDASTKDAIFALGVPFRLPDLKITGSNLSFPAYSNLTVPLSVANRGAGDASRVLITGTVPSGLTPVGITEPSECAFDGPKFSCLLTGLAAGHSRPVLLTVSGTAEGSFVLNAGAGSAEPDADVADNTLAITLTVTPALSSLPPIATPPATPPTTPPSTPPATPPATGPAPAPVADAGGGGGCTLAPAGSRFDPVLILLLAVALGGRAWSGSRQLRRGLEASQRTSSAGT
jgi:Domain of unknown function DUF11